MPWIILIVLTALFFGLYNFFIKMSAGQIHQILGAVILQAVALLLGGAALLLLKWRGVAVDFSAKGMVYAILAGVFVGLAEITSFYVFSKGINASVGIPVIVGGTVLVGAVLGIVFLKESVSWIQLAGIACILIGVAILASYSA
jgi:bacterial/archaeal transporter family protein